MKTLKMFALVAFIVCLALPASAQSVTTQTTLSAAMGISDSSMTVASATGFTARGGLQQDVTLAFVDAEEMSVVTVNGTIIGVIRGRDGTPVTTHASGAVVYVGPVSNGPFLPSVAALNGSCTASNYNYMPVIAIRTGDVYTCPTSGPASGIWTKQIPQPSTTYVKQAWIPCTGVVSGNATGTNGYATVGTNAVGVYNLQTTNSGTNTHTYTCLFTPRTTTQTSHGVSVSKVVFMYGVQTTGLGTQAVTLASGTLNSVQVFNFITFPTPATSESASSNTLARADSGTLVLTPTAANFNVGTSTAGTFYSQAFIPAAPITFNTDLQALQVTIPLLNTATSATITNSPGALVYYTETE